MTSPVFGLEFIAVDDQPQPVIGANMDVIGIVGPCSTADPVKFPLDTPVLRFSNETTLTNDIGPDGYILDAINAVNSQLADFQIAAQLVIVRTPYGTAADANIKLQQTIANMMGQSTAGTGITALLKAPDLLHCTPRLIMVPGYTGQMANSLDELAVTTAGIGYIPGQEYQVNFVPGIGELNGATLVLPQARAIADANGEIHDYSIFIDGWGAWFSAAPTATLPPPDGPPVVGLAAGGQMLFSRQPGVGATINLNGAVISFVSGTPTGLQVQIGANLEATLNSLITFLQASVNPNISQNNYQLVGGTINIVQKNVGAAGNGYTIATTVTGATISGSHLTGGRDAAISTQAIVTASVSLGANPIVAALTPVLNQLIGHAVVESAGLSIVADADWRSTINSRRIIPLVGGIKVMDPISGNILVKPLAPRVIGLIVARDHATGAPFHSAANQPIQGVVAPARNIPFSLTDGATEGQQLLSYNLGIVVRGNVGVETAISSGGFIFIGTDNAGDSELWRMYNVTRGRDYIHLSLMPALRTYLGRSNITKQTVINILATIGDFLGNLKAREHILDYRLSFRGPLNSASEIRLGHLTVGFQAEEPPVLKRITTMSARYKPAIDHMVQELEQQLNITLG